MKKTLLGLGLQSAAAIIAAWAVLSHILLMIHLSDGRMNEGAQEAAQILSWLRILGAAAAGLFLFWLGARLRLGAAKKAPGETDESDAQRGTWTQRVTAHADGVWESIIYQDIIDRPQFRRARFALDGGPTIIVTSDQLRRIISQSTTQDNEGCRLRIEPAANAINGIPLDWIVEK